MKSWMIFFVTIAIVVTLFVDYHISYEIRSLKSDIARMHDEVVDRQDNINILKAEWAFLTRPSMIEKIAEKLLPHLQLMDPLKNVFDDVSLKHFVAQQIAHNAKEVVKTYAVHIGEDVGHEKR